LLINICHVNFLFNFQRKIPDFGEAYYVYNVREKIVVSLDGHTDIASRFL
jgi:hypothetical protein